MYVDLETFNRALRYPVTDTVLASISARQAQIVAGADNKGYVPSAAKWETIHRLVMDGLTPGSTLWELEEKAFKKWVGPQGLAPDYLALVERLSEYFAPPLIGDYELKLAPETELILCEFYAPLADLTPLTPWDVILHSTVRPTGTSTGFDGFTSDNEARARLAREYLPVARAICDGVETPHPVIAWYRSQRNAFRNIFGSALSTLMAERRCWGNLANAWIPRLRTSAYKSNVQIQSDLISEIPQYIPKRWLPPKNALFSFEGDFEHMDTGVCYPVSDAVVRWLGKHLHWSGSELTRMRYAVKILFSTPLVTYDGDVRCGIHSLYSGQYPTNGLEHHIGVFIFYEALVRACKMLGLPPTLIARMVKFKQQGDDSGAIVPDYAGLSDALTECYVQVAREFGQKVKWEKQRVSRESLLFCKNEFSFTRSPIARGWKFVSEGSLMTPIPRYPLHLAWNATLLPETTPPLLQDAATRYDQQIAAVCSIWDNAYGHPNWAANINYLWSTLPSEVKSWVRARLPHVNYRAVKTWEKRVIGENWCPPNAGQTVYWILSH